jgi:hypothetical protein
VQSDLLAGGIDPDRGRNGMSGEQVLRAFVIKQMNGSATKTSRSTSPRNACSSPDHRPPLIRASAAGHGAWPGATGAR